MSVYYEFMTIFIKMNLSMFCKGVYTTALIISIKVILIDYLGLWK